MEYALGVGLIYAVNLAILAFLLARTDLSSGALVLAFLVGIPLVVAYLVLVVKRCHDMGLPGSFLLLLFVPIAGLFWFAALFLVPGNAQPNMYGPPPAFRRD